MTNQCFHQSTTCLSSSTGRQTTLLKMIILPENGLGMGTTSEPASLDYFFSLEYWVDSERQIKARLRFGSVWCWATVANVMLQRPVAETRGRTCQLWGFQSVAMQEDSLSVGISPDVTSPRNTFCLQKKTRLSSAFQLFTIHLCFHEPLPI